MSECLRYLKKETGSEELEVILCNLQKFDVTEFFYKGRGIKFEVQKMKVCLFLLPTAWPAAAKLLGRVFGIADRYNYGKVKARN